MLKNVFPPHLDYLKDPNIVWFNPCWGYFGFWKRIREFRVEQGIDFQTAWMDRSMKRNKEIYATSLLALSMRQDAPTKNGWWLTKPQQDPPDGVIGTVIETPNGNIIKVREVEVVEHFNGSVLETLKNKMENKRYEPNTALICLMSPNSTYVFDFISLSQQIKNAGFPLMYIFVVFHGIELSSIPQNPTVEDLIKTTLVQLTPEYVVISSSPHNACKMWREGNEKSFLNFLGRSRDTGLQEIKVDTPPKLFD